MIPHLRRTILETAAKAGEGHIPSALSILDIVWHLYDKVLKIRFPVAGQDDPLRDRFILSKGHGCLALYAVLAEKGFFPPEWLDTFCKHDSPLGGHPDCLKVPGVEASTGSLGHGLPIAVGMAMGLRLQQNPARLYCLIGDGEANEGSIWEAITLAAHMKLGNLCVIVDDNGTSPLNLGNLTAKFRAFGWQTFDAQGHDEHSLTNAFRWQGGEQPYAVIAKTVKGKGVAEMEGNNAWHHRSPAPNDLERMLEETR
jgi:transketolase